MSERLWQFPGARPMAFAGFVLPLRTHPVLIVLSFSAGDSSLARWEGFSTRWYAVVAAEAICCMPCASHSSSPLSPQASAPRLPSWRRSPPPAGVSACKRRRSGTGTPADRPGLDAAIAMLLFFVSLGVPLGLMSLILAHTVFAIPIAYLPIRARLQGLDPALTEAAADLYAGPGAASRASWCR